jgi:hypothetical protein
MIDRYDGITKAVSGPSSRRSVVQRLGALALGSAVILPLTQDATADELSAENTRRRCILRCKENGGRHHRGRRRQRCRNKCANR